MMRDSRLPRWLLEQVGRIGKRPVMETAPTTGQAVVWDSTLGVAGAWKPGTPTTVPKAIPAVVSQATGTGVVFPSNTSFWPGAELVDAQDDTAYMWFLIPADFHALVSVTVVVVPKATGNLYRDTRTEFATTGEDFQVNTDSIAVAPQAVTNNQVYYDDVSAAFTGVAAGDTVCLAYRRQATNVLDTVAASVFCVGGRLEYT